MAKTRLPLFCAMHALTRGGHMKALTHLELRVLLVYMQFANNATAHADPGLAEIGRLSGDENTGRVGAAVKKLEGMGWLEVIQNGGGWGKTTTRRLTIPGGNTRPDSGLVIQPDSTPVSGLESGQTTRPDSGLSSRPTTGLESGQTTRPDSGLSAETTRPDSGQTTRPDSVYSSNEELLIRTTHNTIPPPASPPADDGALFPIITPAPRPPRFTAPHADAIYAAYPRKKKPLDARRAILKALARLAQGEKPDWLDAPPADPVEFLTAQTKKYADYLTRAIPSGIIEMQFVPYPATWFNQGGYLENPASPERSVTPNALPRNGHTPRGQPSFSEYPEITPRWAADERGYSARRGPVGG